MLNAILKSFKWGALLTLSLASQAANAGFVTIDESGVDAIFSQSSFGSTAIDIRFLTATEYVAPSLLSIDSSDDFNALHDYGTNLVLTNASYSSKTLPMYFLDDLTYCGSNAVGCALSYYSAAGKTAFGSFSMFESSYASGSYNDVLLAHELAHNLGLDHLAGTNTNLMNSIVYDGSGIAPLTTSQVSSLFNIGSYFIQQDANGYFIEIAPIAIVASATAAVPEPSTYLMFGVGLMAVLSRRKAKKNILLS